MVTEQGATSARLKRVPKGAILLAMYGATVGRLGVLGIEATTNQAICHIVPDDTRVDRGYLYHAIAAQVPHLISKGVGGAQPNISQGTVRSLRIPLPSLPEQRRIAALLDKADALIAKRQRAIAMLDELAQAVFLEMFGDPVTNEKGWEAVALHDVCTIAGQYGANVSAEPYDAEKPRYVRITDVDENGRLNGDTKSPAGAAANWTKYILSPGDFLFARSGATVGKTYMHHEDAPAAVFAGYMIRFRLDPERCLPSFLFQLTKTRFYRDWVSTRSRTVAQPNINAKQYGTELIFPLPPVEIQRVFEGRIRAFEATRRRMISEAGTVLSVTLRARCFPEHQTSEVA